MSSLIPLNSFSAQRQTSPDDYLIFGGTFDPIHQGHVSVIKEGLQLFPSVVIAPTSYNPWKKEQPTPLETRVRLIELVLNAEDISQAGTAHSAGVFVEQRGYVYVEDLLNDYRKTLPGKPYWIVAEDLAASVAKWRNWVLLDLTVIVAPITLDIHSTDVRNGQSLPHPALREFCIAHGLYGL